MNLSEATSAAKSLVDQIAPLCVDGCCSVAGEIRRKQSKFGGISTIVIVAVPDMSNPEKFFPLRELLNKKLGQVVGRPFPVRQMLIKSGTFKLEILFESRDTWAVALFNATGPESYCMRAAQYWNRKTDGKGTIENNRLLLKSDTDPSGWEFVPTRTEEEFYAALGKPWHPPELRKD